MRGPGPAPGAPRCVLTAGQLRRGVLGSGRLARLQGRLDALRAGDGPRDLLGDGQAEALELRDVDVLDADIGNRVQSRVLRVDRVDRFQGDGREGLGRLLVVRVVVQRGPGAWRDRGPAVLLRDQLVVLPGGGSA